MMTSCRSNELQYLSRRKPMFYPGMLAIAMKKINTVGPYVFTLQCCLTSINVGSRFHFEY